MFATQVLPDSPSKDVSEEENNSDLVGFLIVSDNKFELKKGETRIGRDSSLCSVVIENFTVSKVHAVIESEGLGDTFIYDAGSTNQTKLGKKIIKPHCRYKLESGNNLTLGNITAKFIEPPNESSDVDFKATEPVSGNINTLQEAEDIFDAPTQVTVKPVFEKSPRNLKVFKVPSLVQIPRTSTLSKSIFDEETQCIPAVTKPKTVYCDSSFENSEIFNIGTQCQLYEAPNEQESACTNKSVPDNDNKKNDSDKINLLLNDGQDDILCTFMSLHSPNEQSGLLKEINIKTEVEDFNEVFDPPNQARAEVISEPVSEKALSVENSSEPSTTNKTVNCQYLTNPSEEDNPCTQHVEEEDYIPTQKFNINHPETAKKKDPEDLSQSDDTQPYVVEELSQQNNDYENMILTQAFEIQDHQNKSTSTVIPESEELILNNEDFIGTQIFALEKENDTKGVQNTVPVKISEGGERDVENLNFTQRNPEDDFVETQVFEELINDRMGDDGSERIESDDEDFIATQIVELPLNKIGNVKNCQQTISVAEAASRESSPDLLASEISSKDIEDCIGTQIFEAPDCQNHITTDMSKRISSPFKGDCHDVQNKVSTPVESSGDETESDLEIVLEKYDGQERSRKFVKTEPSSPGSKSLGSTVQDNDNSNSSYVFEVEPNNCAEEVTSENIQHKPTHTTDLTDSDATDCEEVETIGSRSLVKKEPDGQFEFEDTQVLTLTMPDNFAEKPSGSNDDWMTGAESPKFEFGNEKEPWSPLSLDMPNTQEIESAVNRMEEQNEKSQKENKKFETPSRNREVEVDTVNSGENVIPSKVPPSTSLVDSPLKRSRGGNSGEEIPVKKCKTQASDRLQKNSDRQFSKLVQAHDIAQIQPSRTRNSLKNLLTDNKIVSEPRSNINNERSTSHRKNNPKKRSAKTGDITPYLSKKVERRPSCGGQKKGTSPNDNQQAEGCTRVLRSSKRVGGNITPTDSTPIRRTSDRNSRRYSRTKNGEYFSNLCVNVVFTGIECRFLDKVISDLGGKKTNDLSLGEVVVTDKVRRTVKFLCAIGMSLPITSPEWLLSCKKEKKFLNPWDFILKDEESEKKWNFKLRTSLERSKKVKLLQGFSIFATKSTKPPVKELLAIVECCGGTPLFDCPDVWPKKTIIVSCLEDKKWWPLAKFRQIKIVHYEFILSGILRQEIDFKTYLLR